MDKKVGIIGFGNMGSAITEHIKEKYQVAVFDKDKNKTQKLFGLDVTDTILDLVNKSDVIILAVKPQDFEGVLLKIKNAVERKLIISIAAGIKTSYIEKRLRNARVIRTMPNLLARIGKATTCICRGRTATVKDITFSRRLFNNLGKTLILNENMMDAATAISGSGPGYLFDLVEGKTLPEIIKYEKDIFIPSLAASAESAGFSRNDGRFLASSAGSSCHIFLEETKLLPAEAKKQVTSKRGTTEAGLKVLKGRIANLKKAVKAALKRARELSRG